MKAIILCDFDGTITKKDTLVDLLDTFGPASWHKIEQAVKDGDVGARTALRKEFSLFYINKTKYISFLNKKTKIDPAFNSFLRFIKKRGLKFVILSGGFSLNIKTILKKYKVGPFPHFANRLLFKKDHFEIDYTYPGKGCTKCGNCKKNHLLRYRKKGYYIIYIGDSTTDRCPSREADLVFAKHELAVYLRQNKIPYISYKNFGDIRDFLKSSLRVSPTKVAELGV